MPLIEHSFGILALWSVIGYLLGSIPSGVIIARLMGLGNLRDIGSGNIGATNVLRTGNKAAALLTLLFDAGKGVVAVLLGRILVGEDAAQLAGLFAMIGHCYPVWLRFKGGKGVATFLGIFLTLSFPVGLACCAAWLVTAAVFRYSSLAALVAVGMSPVWMLLLGAPSMLLLGLAFTILIYARHWGNITRLRIGAETKIGKKSS
ncbi:MAG: glycerol-3-phosphate 1-O-acyltransferase PlsY [Paracoccaceae bacterium]|jgi:acyl phosphate:glycerol-3-phosphate acyltransferase|nr:glycerol-3-phosphate 1-O-acyltransferase PlsY [Paracoccaceae bacterium]